MVDGRMVDLFIGQRIATSFQAGSLGDVSSRKFSHSNIIEVPKTVINKGIFGFPNLVTSLSDKPYTKLPAVCIQDGIETLVGFVAVMDSFTTFKLVIYDNSVDLIDTIAGILSELDFSANFYVYVAPSDLEALRNTTSLAVCPVINYGQIDTTLAAAEIGYPPPSCYYKSILERIFTDAGYTMIGAILNDLVYKSLILPYSRPNIPGPNPQVSFLNSFYLNQILPDIKNINFFKDFLVRFGVYFKVTGTEVTFKTLSEILDTSVSNIPDWTAKRSLTMVDRVKPFFGDYKQQNLFRYPGYEGATDPNGSLNMVNATLDKQQTLYDSIFAYSQDGFQANSGVDMIAGANIPVWNTVGGNPSIAFNTDPVPRLLQVRPRVGGEPDVTYNGTPYNDYLVGCFTKAAASLSWGNGATGLLDLYYAPLQSRMNKAKSLERFYLLTKYDIQALDVFKPIWDTDSYFRVDRVDNFVSGQDTKVFLTKI